MDSTREEQLFMKAMPEPDWEARAIVTKHNQAARPWQATYTIQRDQPRLDQSTKEIEAVGLQEWIKQLKKKEKGTR